MKKISVIFLALFVLFLSACSEVETKKEVTLDEVNGDTEKNIGLEIESALLKIIDTPSASSNPSDYVKANQEEFNYIVGQGNRGLNYMMHKFSTSNNDGLEEYVMAIACAAILGDANQVDDWDTGRNWYNSYKKI